MDPDSFISGNFYLIRLFIFGYIGTVKNTVRECSQFIQNKEQNVNYSVLYRNYLFDTRRVIDKHRGSGRIVFSVSVSDPDTEIWQKVPRGGGGHLSHLRQGCSSHFWRGLIFGKILCFGLYKMSLFFEGRKNPSYFCRQGWTGVYTLVVLSSSTKSI